MKKKIVYAIIPVAVAVLVYLCAAFVCLDFGWMAEVDALGRASVVFVWIALSLLSSLLVIEE